MQALADSSGGSSGDCVLVYRARRPFHPGRLHTFMAANLSLRQPEAHQHAGSCAHDGGDHRHHHHCGDGGSCSHSHSHQQPPQPVTSRGDSAEAAQQLQRATAAANAASSAATAAAQRLQEVSSGDAMAASAVQACAPAVAAAAQAAAAAAAATAAAAGWLADRLAVAASTAEPQAPAAPAGPLEGPARGVVRAKGYAWLATRPDHCGDWSQAGRLLTFGAGGCGCLGAGEVAWVPAVLHIHLGWFQHISPTSSQAAHPQASCTPPTAVVPAARPLPQAVPGLMRCRAPPGPATRPPWPRLRRPSSRASATDARSWLSSVSPLLGGRSTLRGSLETGHTAHPTHLPFADQPRTTPHPRDRRLSQHPHTPAAGRG